MIRIIPAIDLIDAKCVRLTQGDYNQKKVYHSDPLEMAKYFEGEGIQYLHLVDLDGARNHKIVNWKILNDIAKQTQLKVDFGGGLRSDDDVRVAFECGAHQVTGGSVAVKDPDLFLSWVKKYGSNKIILGADVRDDKVAVSAWKEDTDVALYDFLKKYAQEGLQYIICTDIHKDGLMKGPSFELYKGIIRQFPDLKLIASGGVNSLEDIEKLDKLKVEGVIIGKAIYEEKIMINQLRKYVS